jgi:hypothetical protein
MSEPILSNPKLVKLLRRENPLAPAQKKKSRRKDTARKQKTLASGRVRKVSTESDSSSVLVQQGIKKQPCLLAVDEDEPSIDEPVKETKPSDAFLALQKFVQTAALLTGDASIDTNQVQERAPLRSLPSKPITQETNEEDYGPSRSSVQGIVARPAQAEEPETAVLREFVDHSSLFTAGLLEIVAEEDEEYLTDDDASVASEAWNARLQQAKTQEGHLCNDLIELLEEDGDTRAVPATQTTIDGSLVKCLGAFFVLLVLRMVFKGVTGVAVSASPIGGQGVIFCAAMLKSLVYLQRVCEANRDAVEKEKEAKSFALPF